MEYTEKQLDGMKAYSELIQKCWDDAKFKQELIQNPTSIKDHLNIDIPADKKVKVLDCTDVNTIYFNIPPQIDPDDLVLSDEQLEMVAGGITPALVASSGWCATGAGVAFGAVFGAMSAYD